MSFAAQIANFSAKTKDKLQRVRRGVVLKLFAAVILDTPVLTGRLRANWRISEEAPDFTVDESTDPTGGAAIARVNAGVMASTGGKPLYLCNSLPYAARIEFDGWSHTKAPEGMVRRNVVRFNGLIQVEAAKT